MLRLGLKVSHTLRHSLMFLYVFNSIRGYKLEIEFEKERKNRLNMAQDYLSREINSPLQDIFLVLSCSESINKVFYGSFRIKVLAGKYVHKYIILVRESMYAYMAFCNHHKS